MGSGATLAAPPGKLPATRAIGGACRYRPAMSDLEVLEHGNTPIGTIYLGRRQVVGRSELTYAIQISA